MAVTDDIPTRVRLLEREAELEQRSNASGRERVWAAMKDHEERDDHRFEKLEGVVDDIKTTTTRILMSVVVACILFALDVTLRLKG